MEVVFRKEFLSICVVDFLFSFQIFRKTAFATYRFENYPFPFAINQQDMSGSMINWCWTNPSRSVADYLNGQRDDLIRSHKQEWTVRPREWIEIFSRCLQHDICSYEKEFDIHYQREQFIDKKVSGLVQDFKGEFGDKAYEHLTAEIQSKFF